MPVRINQLSLEVAQKHLRLDRETGRLYWLTSSKGRRAGDEAGSVCNYASGRRCMVHIDGGRHMRSRIVFLMAYGYWPANFVDHINRDSLDDRPENLREATPQQNGWNRDTNKPNATGFLGVRWKPKGGRFEAQIRHNYKNIYIGTFDTAEEAHAAYIAKRNELRGEFA